MKRKLTVSLVLIISLFVLNIIGINLIENTFLDNNTELNANLFDRGWAPGTQGGQICIWCCSWLVGGCMKESLPDTIQVCIHM